MPFEIIGEFGTPGAASEWLIAESKLAGTSRNSAVIHRLKWNWKSFGRSTSSETTRPLA
jgi:hypothetical protein